MGVWKRKRKRKRESDREREKKKEKGTKASYHCRLCDVLRVHPPAASSRAVQFALPAVVLAVPLVTCDNIFQLARSFCQVETVQYLHCVCAVSIVLLHSHSGHDVSWLWGVTWNHLQQIYPLTNQKEKENSQH